MTRQRDVCEVSAGVSVIGSSATVRTCGKPAVVAVREEHESPVVRCWTRGGRPSAGQEVGIGTCRAVVALAALSQAAAWGVSCASLGVAREAVRGGGR